MKLHVFFILLIGIFSVTVSAEGQNLNITPEIALKSLEIYRNDPIGEQANAALSIIVNFAESSSEVLVVIKEDFFPFQFDTINPDALSKFAGAYIAGNIEYQLINRVKENRPVEGAKLMIITYQSLRSSNAIGKLEGFEKWVKLLEKGQLENAFNT